MKLNFEKFSIFKSIFMQNILVFIQVTVSGKTIVLIP